MPKSDEGGLGDISKLASGFAIDSAVTDALAGFDASKLLSDNAAAAELQAQIDAGTAGSETTAAEGDAAAAEGDTAAADSTAAKE